MHIQRIAKGTPFARVDVHFSKKRIQSVQYAGGLLMSQIRYSPESIQRAVLKHGNSCKLLNMVQRNHLSTDFSLAVGLDLRFG
jgi:hypothetical protein